LKLHILVYLQDKKQMKKESATFHHITGTEVTTVIWSQIWWQLLNGTRIWQHTGRSYLL